MKLIGKVDSVQPVLLKINIIKYNMDEKYYVGISSNPLKRFMKKYNYSDDKEADAMRHYIEKIGVFRIYNQEEYKTAEIMFMYYYELKDNDIVKIVKPETYLENIKNYLD